MQPSCLADRIDGGFEGRIYNVDAPQKHPAARGGVSLAVMGEGTLALPLALFSLAQWSNLHRNKTAPVHLVTKPHHIILDWAPSSSPLQNSSDINSLFPSCSVSLQ